MPPITKAKVATVARISFAHSEREDKRNEQDASHAKQKTRNDPICSAVFLLIIRMVVGMTAVTSSSGGRSADDKNLMTPSRVCSLAALNKTQRSANLRVAFFEYASFEIAKGHFKRFWADTRHFENYVLSPRCGEASS